MTSSCMIRNQNTNNNYNHQQEEKEEGCVRSTKMAHQRQSISTVDTTKIDDDDEDDEEVSLEFVMSSSSAASAHDDSTGDAETDAHADVLNQNNSKSLSSLPTVVSEGNIRALAARANTHHHHPEPHSPHRMQRRVSFSECVSVRNHLHAADMSDNERSEAWFNGDDYHSIYKTNSKIIRNISKLQKEKEKEAKKAAKKAHKAATKGSGGFPRRGSLSQLFSSSKKKKKDKPHKKKHEPPPPAAVPSTPQQQQQQQAHENQHEDQHEDLDDNDADLAEDDMQEIARFMNKVQGLEEAAASSHEPPSHEETRRRNGAANKDDNSEDADVEDIEEEERRGFSIRGLEQEERSKRRVRDQVYFEAKCTVLSIQEELLSHREAMPDGFCRTTPTRNQRWNDEADAAAACYSDEDDDDDDEEETANTPRDHLAVERDISRNKVALALSLTSSSAAAASSSSASSSTITVQQRTTYSYYDRIAERYTGICSQSAREARQRGMRDEVIAQKISTLAEQHRQRRLRSLSSNPTNTNTNSTNTTTTTQPSASNKKRASRRWSLL